VTKSVSLRTIGITPPDPIATTTVSRQLFKTTDMVNVRSLANGPIIGTQPSGVQGTVIANSAVIAGNYTWVKVDFTTGPDGYVAQAYLVPVTTDAKAALLAQLLALLALLQAQLAALQAQ
jgi:hypothetical protein